MKERKWMKYRLRVLGCSTVPFIWLSALWADSAGSLSGVDWLHLAAESQRNRIPELNGRVTIQFAYEQTNIGRKTPDSGFSARYVTDFRGREFLSRLDTVLSKTPRTADGLVTASLPVNALADNDRYYSHEITEHSHTPVPKSLLRITDGATMGSWPDKISHPFQHMTNVMANHDLTLFLDEAKKNRRITEAQPCAEDDCVIVHVLNAAFDMAFTIDARHNSITKVVSTDLGQGAVVFKGEYKYREHGGTYLPSTAVIWQSDGVAELTKSLHYTDYDLDVVFPEGHFSLNSIELPVGTRIMDLTGGAPKTTNVGVLTRNDLIALDTSVKEILHNLPLDTAEIENATTTSHAIAADTYSARADQAGKVTHSRESIDLNSQGTRISLFGGILLAGLVAFAAVSVRRHVSSCERS